jgi:polyhydroxyalkanoate synthase subunit PhaC
MAAKKTPINDENEATGALNPLVGIAREDLMGAVAVMLRETAGNPMRTMKHAQMFSDDVIKIMTNQSDLAPNPRDKRFMDGAWAANPFYKAGLTILSLTTLNARARPLCRA